MTEAIREECRACGDLFFPNSQRTDCPHDYTSSFTRSMIEEVKRRLSNDV